MVLDWLRHREESVFSIRQGTRTEFDQDIISVGKSRGRVSRCCPRRHLGGRKRQLRGGYAGRDRVFRMSGEASESSMVADRLSL